MAGLKVLMLAAEAAPLIKVGGLGDVLGALPGALQSLGHEVRVMIPHYSVIDHEKFDARAGKIFRIPWAGHFQLVTSAFVELQGVRFDLVGGEPVWENNHVYTDELVDSRKFVFFGMAALALAQEQGFQPDVLHVHDSHPGAALYYVGTHGLQSAFWRRTATALTIHNLPFQMNHAGAALAAADLQPADIQRIPPWARDSLMALAIEHADLINAVSPGYAQEIQSEEFGAGLQGLLRARADRLVGILNGVDYDIWNPQTDPTLAQNFGVENLALRVDNKVALQREAGLAVAPSAPMLGVVSRLDHQKGFDISADALRQVLQSTDAQLVLLGSGRPEIVTSLRQLQATFPTRVSLNLRFDAGLARRIYAGSDALLMPSRYEPGGLAHLIGMRYGCLPIVRAVGGLRDTVINYAQYPELATGFAFQTYTVDAFADTIYQAVSLYHQNSSTWHEMQLRAMRQNFSWTVAAQRYEQLYQQAQQYRRHFV